MRVYLDKVAFAIVFVLTLLFVLSCGKHSWDDDFEPSSSSYAMQSSSSVTLNVTYDGETYETVVIGTQMWLNRNLNYNPDTGNSWCNEDNDINCAEYGRLYDWATAMALPQNCNSSYCIDQINTPHQGICPPNFHIPTDKDWSELVCFAYSTEDQFGETCFVSPHAARYLKAASGWYNCGPSGSGKDNLCEDTYGFAALPGGFYSGASGFTYTGGYGGWLSATESIYDNDEASLWLLSYRSEVMLKHLDNKSYGFSVRCLKD